MTALNTLIDTRFSSLLAIGSFIIGSLLLIAYTNLQEDGILLLGIIYVILAALLNLYVLLKLMVEWVLLHDERTEITIKILILLSNIPIAFMYFNMACHEYRISNEI